MGADARRSARQWARRMEAHLVVHLVVHVNRWLLRQHAPADWDGEPWCPLCRVPWPCETSTDASRKVAKYEPRIRA